MKKAIILYSTTDEHTIKISKKIKSTMENNQHIVNLLPITCAYSTNLNNYDKIIIGASIRYGKHHKEIFDFISKNKNILNNKISAFFSVNLVARKLNKNTPETNPYIQKFLSKTSWNPDKIAVFPGKIDYQKYNILNRIIIRFIMLMTNGPTDPHSMVEFTNWHDVD
ncbi:MAG: menaquinone-dependent protoporphyrinogen IX dehydrogenase, partial [Bacteriovoracaceae bacterium]|nr:menaquinone-dependent protoporphyrinogen IX dehydrogenase [Bacteriovoracaceae bacterium]